MTDPTIARRTLVRGSAWVVPPVVASAAVPAYAASGLTAGHLADLPYDDGAFQ